VFNHAKKALRLSLWASVLLLTGCLAAPSALRAHRGDDFLVNKEVIPHEKFEAVGQVKRNGFSHGSAVLIAEDVVLTAAHVMQDTLFGLKIPFVGLTVEFGDEVYHVRDYAVCPGWDVMVNGDIAIVRLDRPTGLTPLALNETEITFRQLGRFITQIGFGHDGEKRSTLPDTISILGSGLGTDLLFWLPVYSHLLPGDSGGAVVWWSWENGQWELIGINSLVFWQWWTGNVYLSGAVRVDMHVEWIKDTIEGWSVLTLESDLVPLVEYE
jgi:hypothetical protein